MAHGSWPIVIVDFSFCFRFILHLVIHFKFNWLMSFQFWILNRSVGRSVIIYRSQNGNCCKVSTFGHENECNHLGTYVWMQIGRSNHNETFTFTCNGWSQNKKRSDSTVYRVYGCVCISVNRIEFYGWSSIAVLYLLHLLLSFLFCTSIHFFPLLFYYYFCFFSSLSSSCDCRLFLIPFDSFIVVIVVVWTRPKPQ